MYKVSSIISFTIYTTASKPHTIPYISENDVIGISYRTRTISLDSEPS